MFTSPATPNLADYLSFLSSIGIPPARTPQVFPTASGQATGGDTDTLQDLSQTWIVGQWAGYVLIDSTQGETAAVSGNDPSALTFVTPVATAIAPGDQYQIVPDIAPTSLAIALEIVNETLAQVSPSMYTLAVYNLAADRLINYAQDVAGQTFFEDLRGPKKFDINRLSVGVPSQVNDQGTAVGILNPEQLKLLTLADLQTLRTPWGRAYMGIAQSVGRTLYGLS